MAVTLHDATAARFLQTLEGVSTVLERGLAHCADTGVDPAELVQTRLWSDMLPLGYQVVALVHHSLGALQAVKAGAFSPPARAGEESYGALQALVERAREGLQALTPDEVDSLETRELVFKVGDRETPFVGKDFLLSFSLPNFYFHVTTAYDILRSKGAPLGKRDYLGPIAALRR